MPYAINHGVRIHYKLEGQGSPLVLLHGLTEDSGWWYDGSYVESLRNNYKLILIDIRGHGASDKPHNPDAYKLEVLVNDVVKVLNTIKVRNAHFLGFSMGGWIGFGIGKFASERFHSLVIGSMSPYRDPNEPNELLELFKKGKDVVWDEFEKMLPAHVWRLMTPQIRGRIRTNDLKALVALVSTQDWMLSLEDVLPNVTLPCLLFVGEADLNYLEVKRCAETMPNATLVSFPNLGHIETFFRSDLVLPHVKKFLTKVKQC